ncbi:MAG: hypothetical protein HXY19_08915 [Thermoanaerobaculaceae bacterium]|jgi:hypothetical protein|nr:hypothetical protein [Thermoanaerobaculaceae bacterium]
MWAAVVLACLAGVEVERVVALVNGVAVLQSDVELAMAAQLVPRQEGEGEGAYRKAVAEALVQLELRWQDLESSGAATQLHPDLPAAWAKVVRAAGGETELAQRLTALGLPEALLRELVRRAAVVETYVAHRFAPFARVSEEEIEKFWQGELAPQLRARGEAVPALEAVHSTVEAILRERKLASEVASWTAELEARGEVVRYF